MKLICFCSHQTSNIKGLYAVLCGSCAEGLSVIATDIEQHQQETSQHGFAACMARARKETPFVTKACRLKALIRQAFSNYVSHATASRPSPSGGLRPALTRLHGNITNIDHTRQPLSSSTRNDEEPPRATGIWQCAEQPQSSRLCCNDASASGRRRAKSSSSAKCAPLRCHS